MSLFQAFDISSSGLTANRLRMDVASANIANANTTRSQMVNGEWQPYRRKMVSLSPEHQQGQFNHFLNRAIGRSQQSTSGVIATQIVEDRTPFKLVYDPEHPDADNEGYVRMPNVDILKEMVDVTSATRSYEANVTAMNAAKMMYLKALEIGN